MGAGLHKTCSLRGLAVAKVTGDDREVYTLADETKKRKDMKGNSAASRRSSEAKKCEVEDYSIYPHMDGLRCSTAWKLGSYGDEGVLNVTRIAHLHETFGLPKAVLRDLSRQLGYCLDNEDDVAINLTEVRRSQAIERGQKILKKQLRLAKRGSLTLEEIRANMAPLSSCFASSPYEKAMLPAFRRKLGKEIEITPGIVAALKSMIQRPGSAADMSPSDKRKSQDKRRQYVVETCCYAWAEAGSEVTYTTYSDGRPDGQRHGPLIEFIQTVVEMITDPSQKLSGETIRKDIDGFREALAREEEEFWAPPIFGNPQF